jgi:gamma-glutamyltranspeptidase/glutathione hydrolase
VIDAAGNAVSTTTTLNNSYGSAVTVTGAGFLLNDEMDDFTTAPGKPNMYGLVQGEANAIAPGKRMLSAMTPSIVLDPGGRLFLVVGTPGGPKIITMVYHVISNVIDHRMSLPDAVAAPRMHHQGLPDTLQVEQGGFPAATLDSLAARGHAVGTSGYWGDVEAIIRTAGGWQGVSDSRLGGGGAGY